MKQQEEIKKPEKFGLKRVKKSLLTNIIGLVFMISIIIWLITSITISIGDVFSGGFNHKVLSFSFIGSILTVGYLTTSKYFKDKKLGIKKPKKAPCKSCGKNKTKK